MPVALYNGDRYRRRGRAEQVGSAANPPTICIAYPIADGPATFDSGQLGFNSAGFGAPAVERDKWTTPSRLKPGTYNFFCRVHPFMRGRFRVLKRNGRP